MAPPSAAANGGGAGEDKERATNTFKTSVWDDFFLTYQHPLSAQKTQMQERVEVLTEQVRTVIKDTNEIPTILDLTISLERLGLEYHYETEISQLLDVVFNSDYDDDDLHLVSLRFYILRKNRYDVASDVFKKFQDKEGNFINFDTKSMLSLYNAAYLGTHEDEVLDKAISFSRGHLMGVLEHLESPLAHEVSASLHTPLIRRVGILEARSYIPNYGKEATRNEAIFELAKLNFNLLQLQFCDELKECTMWWKDLLRRSSLNFARHRIVESYFWMNGACYKPQYSHSRIILAKMTYFITILDDIFDTYGTTTESIQLQQAINRWDESEVARLPEYLKDFYLFLLESFSSIEEELGHEKSYRVFYLRETLKQLVQTYAEELRWRDENYVPKTLGEHLDVSSTSIGTYMIACSAYMGMDDITTEETFKWLIGHPQLVKSMGIFVRLTNDVVSNEREEAGYQCASTVQCYMNEHGGTKYDACQHINELVEDSWKDMLVHSLAVTNQPTVVPRTILYLAKTVHNMYKHSDGFTTAEPVRDQIRLLFVEPI